ncbi:MAG TPA: D-aminoacyl-tRNA deacylase [Planctomycetota bacterium]|nr:D-aminoacyl-tRNA deacylase [Planctomycetota bacterium]
MIAVLQRVARASVTVEGERVGAIEKGLLVLLGVSVKDGPAEAELLARKTAEIRIFQDAEGKMNLSVKEVGGSVLVVSQFTLLGDTRKGRRPSFIEAARPEQAIPLYEKFCELVRACGLTVETGRFGADMKVELLNDGPVTVIVQT